MFNGHLLLDNNGRMKKIMIFSRTGFLVSHSNQSLQANHCSKSVSNKNTEDGLTLMLLVANFADTKRCKKPEK